MSVYLYSVIISGVAAGFVMHIGSSGVNA